ncbi:hypothetical protein [Rufibacter psychrotolerans]|uniref:hypothetical protein n=1 Tax=Rufibacter psychrotolerans TaxID=2812556 RepID=UPI0019689D95|nr:hypothetical protein [Rufibacter sp. SYSU D00308]
MKKAMKINALPQRAPIQLEGLAHAGKAKDAVKPRFTRYAALVASKKGSNAPKTAFWLEPWLHPAAFGQSGFLPVASEKSQPYKAVAFVHFRFRNHSSNKPAFAYEKQPTLALYCQLAGFFV